MPADPGTPVFAREFSRSLTAADGVALSYRLWRAPANPARRLLVLLHGMASNHTRWSEFLERTALKDSWDVLRPDLRGHGESFTRAPLGAARWCPDLATILDREGYAQAVFAGHSLGAQVAVEFAARYRARTRALALIDPVLAGTLRGSALWVRRLTPAIRIAIALARAINRIGIHRRHIPNRDLRRLDEDARARLLAAGRQEDMIRLYTSPWEDLKYFPTANYLQEFIEVTRPLPPLATIPVPTLVLLSRGATFTDPDATRRLLKPLAHVRIVDLPAYHWPLTEKPDEVRRALEDWCATLDGG
jgi:pimeloyl-ACP methyl ester carboxylesterase